MSALLHYLKQNSLKIRVADLGAGMHWGNTTDGSYRRLYDEGVCFPILFEPLEEAAQRLRTFFGNKGEVIAEAVGDGNPWSFYETNVPAASGCFLPNCQLVNEFNWFDEPLRVIKTHRLKTRTLDQIFEHNPIDFLKMDIQGLEKVVIDTSPLTLSKLCVVQTEVDFQELYLGQPLFGEIHEALRKQGFMFHTFVSMQTGTLHPFRNRGPLEHHFHEQRFWPKHAICALGVFVRNDFRAFNGDRDSFLKSAVIMEEVYKSYDMAYLLLREMDRRYGGNIAAEYLQHVKTLPEANSNHWEILPDVRRT